MSWRKYNITTGFITWPASFHPFPFFVFVFFTPSHHLPHSTTPISSFIVCKRKKHHVQHSQDSDVWKKKKQPKRRPCKEQTLAQPPHTLAYHTQTAAHLFTVSIVHIWRMRCSSSHKPQQQRLIYLNDTCPKRHTHPKRSVFALSEPPICTHRTA